MKIVYIIGGIYSANGMSDVMTRKVNWLAANTDHQLHVVLTERPDLKPFYLLHPSVKVVNFDIGFDRLDTLSPLRKLFLYRRLQRNYRQQLTDYLIHLRPDIVVSALRRDINFINDIPDGSRKIGELHFSRSSYRVFSHPRIPKTVCRLITYLWQRSLIRQLCKLSDFVVLTQEDAECWPELHNLSVIPNSIRNMPDATCSVSAKRVIAAGRYTYQKGFDLLLNAWQSVELSHPEWHLYIFGSGESLPYQEQARQQQLHNVHLNPATSNLQDEMLQSSIFAFTSRYEGFGLVLAEAMACGLVPVSFQCPCGPRDIISNDNDGILVPPNDVTAFAKALNELMTDQSRRASMSQKARISAQRYTEDIIMQSWLTLFQSHAK